MTIDKARVDKLISEAPKALEDAKIAIDGKLDKGYRGQISAFGAAISMGSVLSAVAFFNKDGSDKDHDDQRKESNYSRSKLMRAIELLLKQKKNSLPEYTQQKEAKSEILHAAIALKLAMSLYDWGD